VVWVNEDERRVMEGHTFSRSVIILVRVSRLVLFGPVVHPVIVIPIDTIVHYEIVLGKTTLDDALVLFLGYLIIEIRVTLLGPRSAATLACALELRELIEFGLFFALGAVGHSRR
jgi:hypothetical protein